MKKINYKSDFDFFLHLQSCIRNENGTCSTEDVGWPDFDWTASFWTSSKANRFVVSCRGGVCHNCFNDNGRIHVVANSHGLGNGMLNVEVFAEFPNEIYPDGFERVVTPMPLDIELVTGAGNCGVDADAEVVLPAAVIDYGKLSGTFGQILDEIAAQIEAILGGTIVLPPSDSLGEPKSKFPLFTRGIISIDSEPGRVYRNVGAVRVRVGINATREVNVYNKLSKGYVAPERMTCLESFDEKNGTAVFTRTDSDTPVRIGLKENTFLGDAKYLTVDSETGHIVSYSGSMLMPAEVPEVTLPDRGSSYSVPDDYVGSAFIGMLRHVNRKCRLDIEVKWRKRMHHSQDNRSTIMSPSLRYSGYRTLWSKNADKKTYSIAVIRVRRHLCKNRVGRWQYLAVYPYGPYAVLAK